jgi:hypothetical protein
VAFFAVFGLVLGFAAFALVAFFGLAVFVFDALGVFLAFFAWVAMGVSAPVLKARRRCLPPRG